MIPRLFLSILAAVLLAGIGTGSVTCSAGPITIDGSADPAYGSAIVTQRLGTAFGKNTNAVVDAATGSELDAAYGIISNGVLYLVLAGNLEANYNKVEVFIQTGPGGQNTLTNINPNVDYDGLNRMGAGGNGATNGPGLTFDVGFAPNYWIGAGGGGTPYVFYVNYAALWPIGGGSNGYYLGQTTATNGTLSEGSNPFGIQATINNSNTNGVAADVNGCYTNGAPDHPELVRTGVELGIPLGAIGNPTGSVAVCAFIISADYTYLSNQILGPLGTNTPAYCQGNLAEPSYANFALEPGKHYFEVGAPPCSYSISPLSAIYASSGGTGSVNVTVQSGCSWTATNSAGWITIISGSSGSGNGSVSYSLTTNSSACARTATLTVAGQTVTVSQGGAPLGSILIDGSADAVYGAPIVSQQIGTTFGKNTNAVVDAATGSELDAAYGIVSNGVLYLVLAGNLEANFNNLELFIQTGPGGQNTLTNINPDVDDNGLNRMGAGGNGATPGSPGLTFDANFAPNYWISVSGGGEPYGFFANYAQLWPAGGGTNGYYLGQTTATNGTLFGGTNPFCIQATINNSNTNGVAADVSGCYWTGAPDHPELVRTGVELGIPLGAIGNPTGSVAVCAFITGNGHGYISNQILGPIDDGPSTPGFECQASLGEPTAVDFSTLAGAHYFVVGGCNYAIRPPSALYGPGNGGGDVLVTASNGCSWTATTTAPTWINIYEGNSGSGNGSVAYQVFSNTTTCARTATLTIAGQTHTVSQLGSPGPITIDGSADPAYGSAIVTQQIATAFGKNTNAVVDAATGSELDAAYGIISNEVLYLVLAGNLETNYNKLELFIQTDFASGQNTLTNLNPDVDGNGLNRMGAGGNGATPGSRGLTFDATFAPNYWIGVTGGGEPYGFFANYAQLWPGGDGTNGYYLGQTTATNGTLFGGTNPFCIQATINNSNTNGVGADVNGCHTNGVPYHPETVTTGVELGIPLGAIGNPIGPLAFCAFINGNGHSYISNQILGPLIPGTNGCVGNLGEPTTVNFGALPGIHYFLISRPPPTAIFDVSRSSGPAPLSVIFFDDSTGSPTSWDWTFGDGNSSTNGFALHTYTNPGAYTVQLIVSNVNGSSTNTTTINVYSPFAWWQNVYFGSTNNPNGAPGLDLFGTGMSNTNKFLAGFNPTNAAAYLHIISIAKTNSSDIKVIYLGATGDTNYAPGIASRTNVLDFTTGTASGGYSNNFISTGQTNILSGGIGLGVVTNMTDFGGATNSPSRYYRVRVLLP